MRLLNIIVMMQPAVQDGLKCWLLETERLFLGPHQPVQALFLMLFPTQLPLLARAGYRARWILVAAIMVVLVGAQMKTTYHVARVAASRAAWEG